MCIRQASMFDDLRSRLIAHGFTDIEYNIINMVNGIEKLHNLEAVSPNIPVYQETHEDKTVETLGAGKDHFLILDSCNRLIYQVIMPWSFLFYPYVKAAILSAYNDKPCGDCDGHMREEGYTTITIIKHIPLLDIFKATFPEQKKKHSHLKKHGHHHHHHHHSRPHHHHHHHHHLHSYPVYYNFEEKDGHKMSTDEQYEALQSFLSKHLHSLNINNNTFEVHSHGSENDYKHFNHTEFNIATEHGTQSDIFGNTVVYTDELTKVPVGTDPIRVEQMEGNVQESHHTISKDEILSQNSPPLQITLWYPHYHIYEGQRLKDHYFIVLHSNDPKYHGHVVPDSSDEKGGGDSFALEREHETGYQTNTTHHHFHEESHSHSTGSQTEVGVQTDESHLSGTNVVQGQNSAFGTNVTGGTGSGYTSGHGSAHTGEHSTHVTGQNFTSGGQNTFGHAYSYNKSYTETSESHHHSTLGTQEGHKENEIITESKKTDLHDKDVSGITTSGGHQSSVSHGNSYETSGHTSSQAGHHETLGHTSHGHSTVTDSADKTVDLHEESDKKVTQGHDTINVSKDTHKEVDKVSHEGKDVHNVIQTDKHTDHSDSVAVHENSHQTIEGTTGGTSSHTGNTGFGSSYFQNQNANDQHGTNSQSQSTAHGDKTQSESSSHSFSQGSYSYSSSSSSSSSSSTGGYPSAVHTIIGSGHDKTVSHEHGSQTHNVSGTYDSGGAYGHNIGSNIIQSSGRNSTDIHGTLSSVTEDQKVDSHSTGSNTSYGFSSGDGSSSHTTSHIAGGSTTYGQSSGTHSSGHSTGGSTTYGHTASNHTTGHISGGSTTYGQSIDSQSSGHSTGGSTTYGQSSDSHSSGHSTGGSTTYGHTSGSHTTGHISGGSTTHGQSTDSHSTSHTGGSTAYGHSTGSENFKGHGTGVHSTSHITGTGSTFDHNTSSHGNYSSHTHGSSSNSTYSHSAGGQSYSTGSHTAESDKISGSHTSHGTTGQSSYSHHGGSGAHHTGTVTQGEIVESVHGGGSSSHGKGGHGSGYPDDRIIFRDDSKEEFDFQKFLEKQEKQLKQKTHLRTMDEGDAEQEPIEKTKDGEELINHYSKILPWIEFPVN